MINKTYRQHKQRDEKTETEGYRIVQEGIEVKEAWLWHVTEKCRVMQACTQIYTHTHTHPPHTHTYICICTLLHATHIQPYLYSSILLNEFASDFVVVGVDVIVVKCTNLLSACRIRNIRRAFAAYPVAPPQSSCFSCCPCCCYCCCCCACCVVVIVRLRHF